MHQHFPQQVLDTLANLNQKGEFYVVGGAVRDAFLGKTPKDFDFMTTTPEALAAETPKVGADFPVWLVKTAGHTFEVAGARKEKKVGTGYKGFTCEPTNSLEEDLMRRDLTINAMAWNPKMGLVMLPESKRDLDAQVLRHMSPAFVEDPVRVFRVARFAAQLDWSVAPETMALMQTMTHEMPHMKMDRVKTEMLKAMASPNPQKFFEVLAEANCLEHWFPELEAMRNVQQPAEHHPEVWLLDHTILSLARAAELDPGNVDLMFSVLGHDFGKPAASKLTPGKFHNHEELGVEPCQEFAKRFSLSAKTLHVMEVVALRHQAVHNVMKLRPGKVVEMVQQFKRTTLGVSGVLWACQSDAQGRGPTKVSEAYPQREFLLGAAQTLSEVDTSGFGDMKPEHRMNVLTHAFVEYKSRVM